MQIRTTHLFLISIMLCLSGCGGGGGGGTTPTPTPTANTAPVADAGDDQTAEVGALVTLDGSGSSDADGDALTFTWMQKSGPDVTLSDEAADKPTFAPPATNGDVELVFELVVSDGTDDSDPDTVSVMVNDVMAPVGTLTPTDAILGKSENIVVTFNEPMDTGSLMLGGNMESEATPTWTENNTVLSLSPANDTGTWTSGNSRTLTINIEDTSGNAAEPLGGEWLIKVVFEDFQAADIVVGQPDKLSSGVGNGLHQLGGNPKGRVAVHDGRLYSADTANHRVLGFSAIPEVDGASADFVIGTGVGANSQTTLFNPGSVSTEGQKLLVTDFSNGRVAVYDPLPSPGINEGPGSIAAVVGNPDFDTGEFGCTADRIQSSDDAFVTPDGKLIVADTTHNRVLIWNSIPDANGAAFDLVLGQQADNICAPNDSEGLGLPGEAAANTLFGPTGVWSDGEKLVVIDSENNRVLLWDTFPTSNGEPAHRVLGQADFETIAWPGGADVAADNFDWPAYAPASNGEQLFIGDYGRHRVLVWNSWPTENQQPANVVLGQADMTLRSYNNEDADDATWGGEPGPRGFYNPYGLQLHDTQLFVTDSSNKRILIFNSK